LVLSVAVLSLLSFARSTPCPRFLGALSPTLKTDIMTMNSTCGTLCSSCVTNPSLLRAAGTTCLNITNGALNDYSDLRKIDKGICLVVNVPVSQALKLGKGNDCVMLGSSAVLSSLDTGSGSDFVYGKNSTVKSLKTGPGSDFVQFAGGKIALLDTGAGDDVVEFVGSNVTANTVRTGSGSDYFLQDFGIVNNLLLGNGDDNVTIYATVNKILLGEGDDEIVVGTAGSVKDINPGAGTNAIGASAGAVIKHVNSDDSRRNSFCAFSDHN